MKNDAKYYKLNPLFDFISRITLKPNKNKTNVLFIVRDSALFHQTLYDAFAKDKFFNAEILILPFLINLNNSETNKAKLLETEQYFIQKNIPHTIGYDTDSNSYFCPLEMNPDIIFYDNPHLWEHAPEYLNPKYLSNHCITCYIPYGLMFIEDQERQYNQQFHNDVNYIFSETDFHLKFYKKYRNLGDKNVISLGYPKLDEYQFSSKPKNKENLWKINKKGLKKIIWAPHHSIHRYNPDVPSSYFSTFLQTYKFMLKLAKENENIEWVFKPHPLLYQQLIDYEEMSIEQAKKYYNEWKDLPNANLYEGGDYIKIFKTSDAIILDSISFLSEYMIVNKPMLFLENPHRCTVNEFGEEIMKGLYTAENEQEITNFIKTRVFNDDDPLKATRERIVGNILAPNPTNAGMKIKDFLKNMILNKEKNG